MAAVMLRDHFVAAVVVLAMALTLRLVTCEDKKGDDWGMGASFIFGDSLVDAGNNNYLSTLSKANIAPNGIDFKPSGGNPTGRYTNGRTIGDIIGNIYYQSFPLLNFHL